MTLPKYAELIHITTNTQIDATLYSLKKTLFELRRQKSTHREIKYHLFIHTKRIIAQLIFKKKNIFRETYEKKHRYYNKYSQ